MPEVELVSIIILTYNRPKYLKEAIVAALNQDYLNFEIVILDNGSDDETGMLINSFSDSRIKHLKNNINDRTFVNTSFTLNLGKYFIITHDDDIMESNFISREAEILEKHDKVVIVGSNTSLIDKDGKIIKPKTFNIKNDIIWKQTEFIKHYLLRGNVMPCPTIMFRTDYVKKNDIFYRLESGPMADLYLLFELNLMGKDIYMISDPIYKYRLHNNQDSEINRINMEIQVQPYLFKLLQKFKKTKLSRKYLNASSAQILSLLIFHLLSKKLTLKNFIKKVNETFPNGISVNRYVILWSLKGVMRGIKKIINDVIK